MGDAKKYYWLKLKDGFFADPKIKKLRKIAGGDTFTIILQKIMLLSIKDGGALEFQHIEPTFAEELALILDEDVENVKATLCYMENAGLAKQYGDYLKITKPARDRSDPDYKKWRNKVFQRDNYTCQKCKVFGVKLNAHHIKEWAVYPELRFEIDNGITLCEDCHKVEHQKAGVE